MAPGGQGEPPAGRAEGTGTTEAHRSAAPGVRPGAATEAFGFISRRTLLKLGLGAGGALLAGGAGLAVVRGPEPAVSGLRVLDGRRYRTLEALARTHLPGCDAIPLGAADFELARAFDGFLEGEPPANVKDLKLALTLVELGPLVFEGRPTPFAELSPEARLVHWQGWMESRLLLRRQAATAFRKFFSLVFYDQPDVWAYIGYPGPVA